MSGEDAAQAGAGPSHERANSLVSVVIVNFNGQEYLSDCVKSVMDSDYPSFEVLLVDNGSTDGSLELANKLLRQYDNLRLIANSSNLGPCAARNIGAAKSNGQYIVFLDIDTRVDRCWLAEMTSVIGHDSRVGACTGKVLAMSNSSRLDGIGGYMDVLGFPHAYGASANNIGSTREIFVTRGVCICVKRYAFHHVGQFDSQFFIFYDENDFCWRLWLGGFAILYVPTAVVYHAGGYSRTKQSSPDRVFHATKNHISMLVKNYGSGNLVKYLPPVILLRIGEVIFMILNRRPDLAFPKMKALLWVVTRLPVLISKRVGVQQRRQVSDEFLMNRFICKPQIGPGFGYLKSLYGL